MANADPGKIEISEEELEEYRELKAREERRRAAADAGNDPVPTVPSRALLADGTTFDYEGAHPTHVDVGTDGKSVLVPVLSVHNR